MEESLEWTEEVTLEVTVRINVKSNPEYFEGLLNREPWQLAADAVFTGRYNPERMDGWADLVGDVDIVDVRQA